MAKNILLVIAHPNPASFNHALLAGVSRALTASGNHVRVRDLYRDGFNPAVSRDELAALQQGVVHDDVKKEQAEITWADGIAVFYPLWWSDRPAMLKGWFDRVMTNGFAFRYGAAGLEGLLAGKSALVFCTAGGGREAFESLGISPDESLRPVTVGCFGFCGITDVAQKMFLSVPSVGDSGRKAMIVEAANLAEKFFNPRFS